MATPEDNFPEIILENEPNAEDRLRKSLQQDLPLREMARLIAAGIDPREAYNIGMKMAQEQTKDEASSGG
jgi:hypothetical protein